MPKVRVVPYNPEWPKNFRTEANRLSHALHDIAVRVHHIGSTAVPGLAAKPVIDILLEVGDLEALHDRTATMDALGYEVMGEYGIPGRRYFRKNGFGGQRTHQVHAFAAGSSHIVRHLAFRDYLIAHPAAAQAYEQLKWLLARRYPDDIEAYMDGKNEFVTEHERLALSWLAAHR